MTKQGETTKKPGQGLMWVGFVVTAIGLLLLMAAVMSGGGVSILSLGMILLGGVLALVGFGQRLLAAVERR